jgi:hypothetical protein
MKKVIAAAAFAWASAAVLLLGQADRSGGASAPPGSLSAPAAAGPQSARSRAQTAAVRPQPAAASPTTGTAEAAKHRAWLKQYCVGCHNERNPLPANDPVKLDSANLDDVLADAATWERVLRKLGVRAMPPQGSPHPTEAEYVAVTSCIV